MRGLTGRTERMWGDWEKVPGAEEEGRDVEGVGMEAKLG